MQIRDSVPLSIFLQVISMLNVTKKLIYLLRMYVTSKIEYEPVSSFTCYILTGQKISFLLISIVLFVVHKINLKIVFFRDGNRV